MKKRILSLVLATVIFCAMAVPVSAAYVEQHDIIFGNCRYSAYSSCYANGYNCLAEYNYSSDDATNYGFKVNVLVLYTQPVEGQVAKLYYGSASPMISQNSRYFDSNIVDHISPAYFVNNTLSYELSVYPG